MPGRAKDFILGGSNVCYLFQAKSKLCFVSKLEEWILEGFRRIILMEPIKMGLLKQRHKRGLGH